MQPSWRVKQQGVVTAWKASGTYGYRFRVSNSPQKCFLTLQLSTGYKKEDIEETETIK